MLNINVKKIIYACCPGFLHPFLKRIEASNLGYRLVHGAFWSLVGAVISRLLILISFVIVARVLGTAGYGQFGIIQSTISMFGVFAGFSLGNTANKYVAELRDTDPLRAGRIMGMAGMVAVVTGILMAAILFVFAPWLAANTLNDPDIGYLLRIGSLILIVEAMNGAQIGAINGLEAFKTSARISIWSGLVSCPMMAIGVYFGGLAGSVWALAANRAFNWLLTHIALRRETTRAGIPFAWRGSTKELAVLWRFSLPAMLSGVMVSPTIWICNSLLVNQPGGYDQMGILQANKQFQQILLFIGNTLGAPLLPMLTNVMGANRKSGRLARINMLLTWSVGTLPALVLIGIPEIGALVFGKKYASEDFTKTYLLILFGVSIMLYKQGLARAFLAHGLMWWGALSNMVWAVTLIGCTWWLIFKGAFGYAIAWAVAYGLNTIIFIPLYTRKKLVPAGTVISLEAGMIWLSLLVTMALSFMHTSLWLRLLVLPVIISIVCVLFWRLLKQKTD